MSTAVPTVAVDTAVSNPSTKDSRMSTTLSTVRTFVLAFLVLAGSLGAVLGSAQDAAASTTYGFWNTDGCYYTWAGAAQGFQRTTTCDAVSNMGWQEDNGTQALVHWDGTTWQIQGITTNNTALGVDGFAVLFPTDGHTFLYFSDAGKWLHIFANPATPNSEVLVEGAAGWVPLSQFVESQSNATRLQRQEAASQHVMIMDWLDMPKPCESSVNGC